MSISMGRSLTCSSRPLVARWSIMNSISIHSPSYKDTIKHCRREIHELFINSNTHLDLAAWLFLDLYDQLSKLACFLHIVEQTIDGIDIKSLHNS